jgi:hypothetical protein
MASKRKALNGMGENELRGSSQWYRLVGGLRGVENFISGRTTSFCAYRSTLHEAPPRRSYAELQVETTDPSAEDVPSCEAFSNPRRNF